MTDFYTLLKQSIIDRDIRDANDRESVYAQARQAIVKQLWAFRPPLAADEIDTRVGAYDDAVERIERDLRAAFASEVNPPAGETAGLTALPEPETYPEAEAEAEAEPDIEAVTDEEIEAPPLAEWRHSDYEDDYPIEETEEAYERNILPAAASAPRGAGSPEADPARSGLRSRWRAIRDRVGSREDPEIEEVEDIVEKRSARAHHSRWSDDGQIESARFWWRPAPGERAKVQILTGAISAMVIALVVLGGYFYFSRGSENGQVLTLDVGVRREVSDAATASRIANDPIEVLQSFSLFDGRDPTIFATTPDNPVRYVSDGGGYARVSSSASSPGVKAIIGPGLADRLAGQRVRVTLLTRSSTDFGAGSMRFAYQSGLAISHWQTANLSSEYEAAGMIWRVPTMRTNPAGDYLVIEPGIPGDGTGVDIQSIKIDVLPPEGS